MPRAPKPKQIQRATAVAMLVDDGGWKFEEATNFISGCVEENVPFDYGNESYKVSTTRGRKKVPLEKRAKGQRVKEGASVEKTEETPTGKSRCKRILIARGDKPERQCGQYCAPGSEYCQRHGAGAAHSALEDTVEEGGDSRAHGLRRVVGGRLAKVWDQLEVDLADDDLGQELVAVRVMLATQLEEMCGAFEEYKKEAANLDAFERVEYWKMYNLLLVRSKDTVEQIRKVVGTIADIKYKNEGNTLTIVQVTSLIGELVNEVTEIIEDSPEQLEKLRMVIEKIDWMPK